MARLGGGEGGFLMAAMLMLLVLGAALVGVGGAAIAGKIASPAPMVDPVASKAATEDARGFVAASLARLRRPGGESAPEAKGRYPRSGVLELCASVKGRLAMDKAAGLVAKEELRAEEVFAVQCGGMVALANSKGGLDGREALLRADRIERAGSSSSGKSKRIESKAKPKEQAKAEAEAKT